MASKGPLCHRRCEGLWCGALRAALHRNEPLGLHHKDLLMETCMFLGPSASVCWCVLSSPGYGQGCLQGMGRSTLSSRPFPLPLMRLPCSQGSAAAQGLVPAP